MASNARCTCTCMYMSVCMCLQDGADLLEQSGLVTDALRTLASRHRRTRAQLAVLAHSMGGVAALHALGGTDGPMRMHARNVPSRTRMQYMYEMPVAAVIGLGIAAHSQPPSRRHSWLIRALRASFWATLLTTPVTLGFFKQLAPTTILLTPLCAPLVAALLLLALIMLMLR